jgi:hypothetical protein
MKKYLPYISIILIPVMTFVIFFVMATKRSFIFRGTFSSEVKAELATLSSAVGENINKEIYSTMRILSEKVEVRSAFGARDIEWSSEIQARLTNTINAYAYRSSFVSNIYLVNNNREIIVSARRNETSLRKFDEKIWNKLKTSDSSALKHILDDNYYIFSYDVNLSGKIILFVDPSKFSEFVSDNKKWLSKNLKFSTHSVLYAAKNQSMADTVEERYLKNPSSFENPVEYAMNSGIMWGQKISIPLRDGRNIKTDMVVFVFGNPKHFPLNWLQKALLSVNALIIFAMLILVLLKIKNENEKLRITEYKERTNFVFDMLEESSKLLDDSARTGELTLDDLEGVAGDIEEEKGIPSSFGMASGDESHDEKREPVSVAKVSDDGVVEIPQSAYERASVKNIDDELKMLAKNVSEGIDLSNPSLKHYWSNISGVLDLDFHISKFALLEKDDGGVFKVAKSQGLSEETIENLKFSRYDKFYDKFFKLSKNLYIIKDAFVNRTLYNMFSDEDRNKIGELLLFPISHERDVIAILCFARDKGLDKLSEDELRDKIIHNSKI